MRNRDGRSDVCSSYLESAAKNAAFFSDVFERRRKLMERGIVNQDRFDTAARNLEQARGRVVTIRQEVTRILSELGGLTDLPPDQHPRVLEANDRKSVV